MSYVTSGKFSSQAHICIDLPSLDSFVEYQLSKFSKMIAGTKQHSATRYFEAQFIMALLELKMNKLALAECCKYLSREKLTFHESLLVQYLKSKAVRQLNAEINSIIINNELHVQIKSFIEVCSFRELAHRKIQELISLKHQLYDKLHKELYPSIRAFYDELFSLAHLLQKTEVFLNENLANHAYTFEENLQIYFYSEIYQHFYKAEQIVKKAFTDRLNSFRANNAYMINFQEGQDYARITAALGDSIGQILSYTEAAPQFFDYTEKEFSMLRSINELVPYPMRTHHDQIMQHFIDSAFKQKFLSNKRQSLAMSFRGFLVPIQKFYYLQYSQSQDTMVMDVFCQKLNAAAKVVYVIADEQEQIKGFSENLFDQIDVQKDSRVVCQQILLRLNMSDIFVDGSLVQALDSAQACEDNIRCIFPTDVLGGLSRIFACSVKAVCCDIEYDQTAKPLRYYLYEFSNMSEAAGGEGSSI